MAQRPHSDQGQALLTIRSALIFLLTALVAIAACLLTYAARHSIPEAIIAAGVSAGVAVGLFNSLISS